jgi:hypothetical protein
MTLIINEIRTLNGLSDSYWVCGADRRLTSDGKFHSSRKKLFPIKYLKGAISYFGLAVWIIEKKEIFLSDILKLFITQNSDCKSLDEFATRLQKHLNIKVPSNLLSDFATGFHIAGFNEKGYPHFLHISNVGKMSGFLYEDLKSKFKPPFADFLIKHAKDYFNWDGIDPLSAENKGFIYRNGDISTHVIASKKFDNMMKEIFELAGFERINNHKQQADYVKFKFEFIAKIYEKWTNEKIIGKPIDILVLTPKGILTEAKGKWIPLK